MCGIAGFVGDMPFNKLTQLWVDNEIRGTDAAGIALGNENIWISKAPATASVLLLEIAGKVAERLQGTNRGLMHCRAATNGNPSVSENNHPILSPNRIGMLVHNGIVQPKTPRKGCSECDSEQLLMALEEKGLVKGMDEVGGMRAIGYVPLVKTEQDSNESVFLFRDYMTPLYLGEGDGFRAFSSRREGLEAIGCKTKALDPWVMYKLTSTGLREWHRYERTQSDWQGWPGEMYDWQGLGYGPCERGKKGLTLAQLFRRSFKRSKKKGKYGDGLRLFTLTSGD